MRQLDPKCVRHRIHTNYAWNMYLTQLHSRYPITLRKIKIFSLFSNISLQYIFINLLGIFSLSKSHWYVRSESCTDCFLEQYSVKLGGTIPSSGDLQTIEHSWRKARIAICSATAMLTYIKRCVFQYEYTYTSFLPILSVEKWFSRFIIQ